MSDLRQAAQQALEALEDVKRRGRWGDFDNLTGTLRAALEADDGMYGAKALTKAYENGWNAAKAEPVQEQPVCDECGKSKSDGWALYCVGCVEPMFVSKAEPVQEPVPSAWRYKDTARICDNSDKRMTAPPGWVPLYSAPPRRKPLTEEEIDSIWDSEKAFADIYAITRAIERAHGIAE